jgi:hypothetical protein
LPPKACPLIVLARWRAGRDSHSPPASSKSQFGDKWGR